MASTIEERKSLIRGYQIKYHPDKNPGKEDEVRPVFEYVQVLWRQIRSNIKMKEQRMAAQGRTSSVPQGYQKPSESPEERDARMAKEKEWMDAQVFFIKQK